MKLIKSFKGRQKQENYKAKLPCKCVFAVCNCEKRSKVSKEEQEFLNYQRNLRLMCINTVDKIATQKLLQSLKRKAQAAKYIEKYQKSPDGEKIVKLETNSDDDKSSDSGKDLATDVDSESNSCTNLLNVQASPRTSSNATP